MSASRGGRPATEGETTIAAAGERAVGFEDYVVGRLTLVALHNQLLTQIAGLRSQLAVAESQLRRTEDLLHRAEEKMEAVDPNAFALLVGGTGVSSAASRR